MLNEFHVFDSLPAYVLGSLDEDEARQTDDHISSCYLCREELQEFQSVAAQFPLIMPQVEPPHALKLRLMDQVRALKKTPIQKSRRWSPSRRMLSAGVITGLLLIFVLAVSNLALWQKLANSETLTGPLGMRAIALQNTDAAPSASGFVIVSADGQNGVLVVDELSQLTEGLEYQLWLVKNGQNTSGAVFGVDQEGYRGTRIDAPESLLLYSDVFITIEPGGGSALPTGEQVLVGSLINP
jgi:anti-sigma-K factor RskA